MAAVIEKAPEVQAPDNQLIVPGFTSLQGFDLSQRVAKLLAQSTLVPQQYQNNLPNCVIALNMAARMGSDPLMVMQNLYIVQGRPSWSSQFLISTFNTSGRFSALRYQWVGEPNTDSWGCTAWAIERSTGEKLEGATVTIGLAKKEGWFNKNGSKWQTMPQQMLMYRAASWFIRAYAPELAMGMHTAEEIQDTIDLTTTDGVRFAPEEANTVPIDVEPEKAEEKPAAEPVKAQEQPKHTAAQKEQPKPAQAPQRSKQATLDGPGY